jgi:DNA-binding MarR family transcriptional regulator
MRVTSAHLRALADPLSWRVLRLCLDQAWTNQQLAERLDVSPATLLRRIRALSDAGFLVAEPSRQGNGGAWERPYRSTGRTWRLDLTDLGNPQLRADIDLALIGAHRAETLENDHAARKHTRRAMLRLDPSAGAEFDQRIDALLEEFTDRAIPGGDPIAVLWDSVEHSCG